MLLREPNLHMPSKGLWTCVLHLLGHAQELPTSPALDALQHKRHFHSFTVWPLFIATA